MKAYTDLEQSKVLAEILPLDSADMKILPFTEREYRVVPINDIAVCGREDEIPCWSLVALFDVLPEGVIENYYVPNLQKENGKYSIAYGNEELLCVSDNPVDACYEIIIRLRELNLL